MTEGIGSIRYEGQGLQGVNVWIDLLLLNLKQTFVFGFHANFRECSSMGKGTRGEVGRSYQLGMVETF